MTDETPEQKLVRYEHVIGAQMAEIAKLREENERLKEGFSAHGVLRAIYSDETQPTGHRIKAAIGAIDRETPRLTPQPPAIDATCEEIVEPLAVVIERQRARADRMQREARSIKVLPSGQVFLLDGNGGNGGNSSDDTAS